jgi:hypothetical protein
MPTPLQLNDDEMNLLLVLAAPIDQRLRPEFLAAVAAELEAASAQTGVGPGLGVLHRVGRVVQRKYFRRSCPTRARRRGLRGRSFSAVRPGGGTMSAVTFRA